MKLKQSFLLACICLFSFLQVKAGPDDSLTNELIAQFKLIDSVNKAMNWQHNTVMISNGAIKLNVPKGFKFLNAEQSKYILHDIWGNPPRPDVLGMIFPDKGGPYADSSYAFILSYEETGYVKDKEANKIDYDEMLEDIKKSEPEANKERLQQGYDAIHVIGWAHKPYYDEQKKVLHWAKELKFGSDEATTLNYDVRVLGRKGILSMNAIASMSELPLVKASINDVLQIAEFTEGNRYADFNSNTDKVAEYGVGALVAGGVLAKTGVLGAIGKFLVAAWKFILIGVVAAAAAVKKFFTGKDKSSPGDGYSTTE
ncbi:MAG: DUF2167 domain-containing protein [Ferruginibacter sp.]